MKVQVQKWGNSLALRIPRNFALETSIQNGSTVDIAVEKGRIIVKPIVGEKILLEDLLNQITEDNLHTEVDFGKPEGKEVW